MPNPNIMLLSLVASGLVASSPSLGSVREVGERPEGRVSLNEPVPHVRGDPSMRFTPARRPCHIDLVHELSLPKPEMKAVIARGEEASSTGAYSYLTSPGAGDRHSRADGVAIRTRSLELQAEEMVLRNSAITK